MKTMVWVMFIFMFAIPAMAQPTAGARTVPYRFTADSGEIVELRVQYRNQYRRVDGYTWALVKPKPDGVYPLVLSGSDDRKVDLTFTVADGVVTAGAQLRDTNGPPTVVLTSGSGESLFLIFNPGQGMVVNSSRTGSQ